MGPFGVKVSLDVPDIGFGNIGSAPMMGFQYRAPCKLLLEGAKNCPPERWLERVWEFVRCRWFEGKQSPAWKLGPADHMAGPIPII